MTTRARPNPGHAPTRRTPAYSGKPLTRLRITFNRPPAVGGTAAITYAARTWPQAEPVLTGELLLAALKEGA